MNVLRSPTNKKAGDNSFSSPPPPSLPPSPRLTRSKKKLLDQFESSERTIIAKMTNDIEILKSKRQAFKSKLTRISNWLKGEEVEDTLVETLDLKLVDLAAKFAAWEVDQEQLLTLDATNEEANEEEGESIINGYFKIAGELKRAINQRSKQSNSPIQRNDSTCSNNQTRGTPAKLPELELPKFDGSFEKFRSWHDEMKAMIHNNSNIQKIIKFQYFKSSLTGEAHDLINDLEMTEENYDIAWELIENTYNNPRLILRRHCTLLLNLYKKRDSPRPLLEIVNAVNSQLRPLNSLATKEDQYNAFLITIILAQLSDEVAFQWENTLTDDKMPSVDQLLDFIKKRGLSAKSTEAGKNLRMRETSDKPESRVKSKKKKPQSSTTSPMANPSTPKNQPTPIAQVFHANPQRKCPVCQSEHTIYRCPKFQEMDYETRMKLVYNQNRCLNCLARGHGVKTCESGKCSICEKKHHTLLHRYEGIVDSKSANGSEPEVISK